MAYIGREPQIGNYVVMDALSASATADYTLQSGSTNFIPESANHLIVSLNGVIQKPGSSFTVAGAVLSFSSALTSNDSIDFVIALGNVLDIGTPSDGVITNAKLAQDIISSETALTDAPADTDELLISDAGTLKRIDYSLIKTVNTPMFSARISSNQSVANNTATTVAFATEHYDIGSDFNVSDYKWTVPETAKYLMNIRLAFDSSAEFYSALSIVKDGTGDIYSVQMGHDEASDSITGTVIASLTATHVYYITAYQSSGGSINLIGNEQQSEFSVFKLIS
tara:strand:- start:64 stop:906 length:843 start_codon:yes stop_codon:yes gene_type:complete